MLERGAQPCLRLRPEAAHACDAALTDRLAEFRRSPRSERAPELDRALRPQPEEAAQPDELRLDLALELPRVRDRARLDELPQPGFDPWSDSSELAHAAAAHELRDGRLQRPDQLGSAAIGAHRVVAGAGEIEQ